MSKSIARVFFGAAAVVPAVLCTAGVSAVAAPEDDKSWDKSNIAMNLGADKSGSYMDAAGNTFNGSGQIVFDIDGAFTGGNPLMKDANGKSKVAGEYCFGFGADPNGWSSLCETTNVINTPYLYKGPSLFSSLPQSSAPSSRCVDSSGDLCHAVHGTATAGAVVGQPSVRYERDSNGDSIPVSSAGAAVGAQVVQVKVGGGTTTGKNDDMGWQGDSVANALNWIDKIESEQKYRGRVAAVTLSAAGLPIGVDGKCTAIGEAIDSAAARLKSKGIAVVMAGGNQGVNSVGAWNCGKNVITVGATKTLHEHVRAGYSNYAASTRLYAPVGEGDYVNRDGVLLPYKSSGTYYVWGTSFAAPQVAGAFAVLREKFGSEPTVDQLVDVLAKTGSPVEGAPATARDINVKAALNATP